MKWAKKINEYKSVIKPFSFLFILEAIALIVIITNQIVLCSNKFSNILIFFPFKNQS